MPFPREIRVQALVAAARHCCVCRRYKGVRIEIHHIEPEAQSHDNSADNAIALCFDCHTDAGHYNPDHSRGTKYSIPELRRARDEWHRIVAEEGIPEPAHPDRLYCRYLLCRDMEILKELTELNLAQIPVENPHLIRNPVFNFWREVIAGHKTLYRHGHLWGDDFPDINSYLKRYPGSEVIDRQNEELPYFKARRELTREEVIARVASEDHISSLLLTTDLPIEHISHAAAYWEVCGGACVQEIYLLRPLWFAILAVTNITGHPLRLGALNVTIREGGTDNVQEFVLSVEEEPEELGMPGAALPQDATALIPVATILPPHQPPLPEVLSVSGGEIDHARVQNLTHCAYETSDIKRFLVWGPRLWPHSVSMQIEGQDKLQEVHPLDPTNVYTLDRYWEMGSCPHLFFKCGSALEYAGELFANRPLVLQQETVQVPSKVKEIEIVELEDEITEIHCIRGVDQEPKGIIALSKGERMSFGVSPSSTVQIIGRYLPNSPSQDIPPNPTRRNELVRAWITDQARRGNQSR